MLQAAPQGRGRLIEPVEPVIGHAEGVDVHGLIRGKANRPAGQRQGLVGVSDVGRSCDEEPSQVVANQGFLAHGGLDF